MVGNKRSTLQAIKGKKRKAMKGMKEKGAWEAHAIIVIWNYTWVYQNKIEEEKITTCMLFLQKK